MFLRAREVLLSQRNAYHSALIPGTSLPKVIVSGNVESQYLVGSSSPSGHSIKRHSSGRLSVSCESRCVTQTRARANRGDSRSAAPSRHLIVRQTRLGRQRASSLTEIG